MTHKTLPSVPFRPFGEFKLTAVKHCLPPALQEEHFHESVELVVIAKGCGTHIVCGQAEKVGAGDVFVINVGASHGFKNCTTLELYNISYMPGLLSILGPELALSHGYQALFVLGSARPGEAFQCRLRLPLSDLKWACDIAATMIAEIETKSSGAEPLLRARFIELVVGLCRRYESANGDENRQMDIAARVASSLERRHADRISIASLAKDFAISPRHLRRVFSEHWHSSPKEYLMMARAKDAASLLEGSSMSMSEIAFHCGYSDSNYFARQFRRISGFSPVEYRKRVRIKNFHH